MVTPSHVAVAAAAVADDDSVASYWLLLYKEVRDGMLRHNYQIVPRDTYHKSSVWVWLVVTVALFVVVGFSPPPPV